MKEYQITLNRNQLQLVNVALEHYFRTYMGQFFDYCTDIAKCGYVYDKDNPDNERLFNEYIDRRNDSQDAFEKAFRIAQPFTQHKTDDMNNAIDMWHVIKHLFWKERTDGMSQKEIEESYNWTVDSYPPMQIGTESLIEVKEI